MTEREFKSMIRLGAPGRDDIVSEPLDGESYSEQIGTRVTPEMHSIILHIINNENTSYRGSISQFMRHAAYELAVAWGMKLPTDNPVANWVTWDLPKRERELELKRLLTFRGWLSVFEAAIRNYMEDDDPGAIIEELMEIEKFVVSIRGTNARYWRRKCINIVASAATIKEAIKYLENFPEYSEMVGHFSNEWGL